MSNCSNNYGPFQFPEKLIPVIVLNALHGRPIPVYGKGENIRDWLFVKDHVAALHRIFTDGVPGETYHVGGNNELRNIDVVHAICDLMDLLLSTEQNQRLSGQRLESYRQLISFVADRPGHDYRYAINSGKLQRELGWTPSESCESGFRKTVQWYLDNEPWWRESLARSTRPVNPSCLPEQS